MYCSLLSSGNLCCLTSHQIPRQIYQTTNLDTPSDTQEKGIRIRSRFLQRNGIPCTNPSSSNVPPEISSLIVTRLIPSTVAASLTATVAETRNVESAKISGRSLCELKSAGLIKPRSIVIWRNEAFRFGKKGETDSTPFEVGMD